MFKSLALIVVHLAAAQGGQAVDVSGEVMKPDQAYGKQARLRLAGDTTFGWKTATFTGDLDLNSHALTMETGGGNRTVFAGAISGSGRIVWNGGGIPHMQTAPSFLGGTAPNTFRGTLTVKRGLLALAKPPGVQAIAGEIVLGGGSNQAILRLDAPHQIEDSTSLTLAGPHEGRLWTQGHSETLGPLLVRAHGTIDLGESECTLTFADSRSQKWDLSKTVTIRQWTRGKDKVAFGSGGPGLTAEQAARVGFDSPSDRPAGLYRAKLLDDGQLVPDAKVAPADPPFDMSEQARRQRETVFRISGRSELGGPNTPLKDGMTISFFGDSITWQNGYIEAIAQALRTGEGTRNMKIRLVNRGVNGGGVLSLRDGVDKAAYVDAKNHNGPQAPFARVIATDRADLAVVFIGINDVWWRKTSAEDFERALHDLASAAKANRTRLVLCTLTVYRELPTGANPKDAGCDAFAELTRKAARETGATLVDLRKAYLAYLQNHNVELRVDGSLAFRDMGVLTYDGVHPTQAGVELLADHIAAGIGRALRPAAP
ncbi:MAG: GDSL-like Lipase/Acylhydrolase [Planctomycetes bacterium ADurb.Bin126]|nr:MAG: GDSL-like Lipase/Acylhydrolase [Planctomycetes bacterium ADurb.Bin126]HOD82487.1 GDSL-type esterase/lipase family protein [Phycisphaerae bacterium]HQL75372.1 GDSL-type esterase/lipase family protein [Phycisphaerae bacterium]